MSYPSFVLTLLGLLLSTTLPAQFVFRDAIDFSDETVVIEADKALLPIYTKPVLKDVVARRLVAYFPDSIQYAWSQKQIDADSIIRMITTEGPFYNPILADLFPPEPEPKEIDSTVTIEAFPPDRGDEVNTRGGGAAALAGLGGLPVTNIADGLARFLVKRSKQELNQAFFRHFYEALQDPRFVEFQLLYPQTFQVFSSADRDIYRYNYFLESLRESFQVDMKTLPGNVATLLQHPKYYPRFQENYHRSLSTLALVSAQELVNGTDPIEAIHNIAYADNWLVDSSEIAVYNLRASFQLVDLISRSMASDETAPASNNARVGRTGFSGGQTGTATQPLKKLRNWLTQTDLNQLLTSENHNAVKFYLGFLYQQAEGIAFRNASGALLPLRDILEEIDDAEDNYAFFRGYISNIGKLVIGLDQQIKSIREQANESTTNTDGYYFFANTFINAIKQGISFKTDKLGLVSAYDSVFVDVLDHANHLGLDIKLKNYSSAVVNMVQVLQSATMVTDFEYKSDLLRYSSFIASVANAASSEEIAYAIEAIALPVGSSAIKKYSSWNLALQAYVGGFYGIETLKGIPNTNQGGQVFGMTAPVGIALSRGLDPFHDAGSLTLFASLIDIGAVTAFRFQDPDAETLPEITLSNIYAPGAYLIYGFPRWPVSIGLGAQMGPQLRQVALDGNLVGASGFRTSAFLAVDIPIFNLYTSMR